MDWPWVVLACAAGCVLIVAFAWRPLRKFGRRIHLERAREMFKLERELLEARFLTAAAATGKPRGLRWKDCQWDSEVEIVRERSTGQVAALVAVTVQFEAVEGGDMEGVEAVGNLRTASAVFFFHGGHWHTAGKAVFNMSPAQAVEHFRNQYERISAG